MKKTLSIKEFLNGKEPEPVQVKISRHFKKYGIVYKVVGATVIILISGGAFDYASAAGNSIDEGARKLYYELANIGKWVIIFKGGIDTIKAIGNGDLPEAKKSFFAHLLIYLMLLGLPYGMDKVDEVFQSVTKA